MGSRLVSSQPVPDSSPFRYQRGELYCEAVPLPLIAEQVGTPCYVYSRSAILNNYRHFSGAFRAAEALTCYAVKANSNLAVLRLLAQLESGFDVVSGGELRRLQTIGADLTRVMFSGVGKTTAEIRLALEQDLLALNVESIEELETVARLAADMGCQARISLRLNPDVQVETHPYISTGMRQHKFGIDPEKIESLVAVIKKSRHLDLVALGCHIGSQILDVKPFQDSFVKLQALAGEFGRRGLPVQILDLGGGIGIPYRGEAPAPIEEYARFLTEHRNGYRLVLEPGRFIVGNAGILLSRVLYRKTNREKSFVIVDAAMNDFMRPALYQAYHEVLPVQQREPSQTVDLVGPVCESGDFFAKERHLPEVAQGDLLAVMNAGAYGFALASNYNSRPRPAEVMVDGGNHRIVRRRERFEDLIELEQ